MKEKVKIVMLPTEKAKIHKHNKNNILIMSNEITGKNDLYNTTPQHLYFLSADEIKEGNWYINNSILFNADDKFDKGNNPNQNPANKKVIASTDESLTPFFCTTKAIALPRPSNEFLKKYCELGGIDEVLVEYEEYAYEPIIGKFPNYKANPNPRLYRPKIAPDNTITIYPLK